MSLASSAFLLAVVTAIACAIPGVFVVLSRQSMLIDGISHAVLPGIALGFLFTASLTSPWLLVTTVVGGLLVAIGSEWLTRSGWLAGDAALGRIYPALFAAGVILISTRFSHVHLDVHAVLVGDLNLAAMTRPPFVAVMGTVAAINAAVTLIALPRLAARAFSGRGLATVYLALVTLTCTAAFHAAGAMLVIALMVFPAITARLLTRRVPAMLAVAVAVAVLTATAGFWCAYHLNAATSPAMTVANAVVFLAVLALKTVTRREAGATHREKTAIFTVKTRGSAQK